MRLVTEEPNISSVQLLEDQEVDLGEALSATASLTWTESISPVLFRGLEQNQEETVAFSGKFPERYGLPENRNKPVKENQVTKVDALAKAEEAGVNLTIPEKGISDFKLSELIRLQQEQQVRNSITASNRDSGFFVGAAKLGTSLGVSVLDPLNVAAAFVPVVGEARMGTMLANATSALGRAGVRARVGAIEGSVGAAALEPLIYNQLTEEQLDYTLTDSFLNVAFGTVFGGGMHMGMGAIGDALAKRSAKIKDGTITEAELNTPVEHTTQPIGQTAEHINSLTPQQREILGRTAVYQMVEGKEVNIEALIKGMDESIVPKRADVEATVRSELQGEFSARTDKANAELKEIATKTESLQKEVERAKTEKAKLESETVKKFTQDDFKGSKSDRKRKAKKANEKLASETKDKLNAINGRVKKLNENIADNASRKEKLSKLDDDLVTEEVDARLNKFKKNKLSQSVSDGIEQQGLKKSIDTANESLGAGSLPKVAAEIQQKIDSGIDANVDLDQATKWLDEITEDINDLPPELKAAGLEIMKDEADKVAIAKETSTAIKAALKCKGAA